jgi:phosphosulfolactate phosphohydrolase-like enzyme
LQFAKGDQSTTYKTVKNPQNKRVLHTVMEIEHLLAASLINFRAIAKGYQNSL